MKQRYGDRIAVVAVAVQSEEPAVRKLAGDLGSVPTLFLFDRDGRAAGAFYGAPPTLHADAEATIGRLLAP